MNPNGRMAARMGAAALIVARGKIAGGFRDTTAIVFKKIAAAKIEGGRHRPYAPPRTALSHILIC